MWTGDYTRAWRVAREIEAGSVWINTYKQSHIATPFGGFKDSGIGSEEHTSELQSLMRISYAVFCLKKKNHHLLPSHPHLACMQLSFAEHPPIIRPTCATMMTKPQ